MSGERAATVYAAALFAAARDAGVADRVGRELKGFVRAFTEQADLRVALLDPQVSAAVKRAVLSGVTDGADTRLRSALQLLLGKGRISIVAALSDEYERLAEEAADMVEVHVTSAVPLTSAAQVALSSRLEKKTGRRVQMVTAVDPAIIGGLEVRLGDDVLVDASVRGRFEQLRASLITVPTRGASQ